MNSQKKPAPLRQTTTLLRQKSTWHSTLREVQSFLKTNIINARFWAIFIVMIMLFAFIGPFGTFERLAFAQRLAYWAAAMVGSWAIAIVILAFVISLFRKHHEQTFMLTISGSIIAAFPIAAYLQNVLHWFSSRPENLSYWQQLFYALPISVSFAVMLYFILSNTQNEDQEGPFDDAAFNALLERLSIEKRGPVLFMSMQDHYIKITTTRGSELILMRMGDAVKALSAQKGLQIHRSHWVSLEAVVSTTRKNGKPFVVLPDDTELPISRSYIEAAREQGLL